MYPRDEVPDMSTTERSPKAVRSRTMIIVMLAMMMIATACGAPAADDDPTATAGDPAAEEADPGEAQQGDATELGDAPDDGAGAALDDSYVDLYAELEGLSREDRTARLIELANEEGGVSMYTSNTQMQEVADEFEDFYEDQGLESRVAIYRAPSNTVLQRLLEEGDAGFRGADVTEMHAPQLAALTEEQLLGEFRSPVLDDRREGLDFPTWSISRMTAHVVAWNTDLVTGDDVPNSYDDLVDPKWEGKVMMEPRAFDWFLTLWEYFEEQGQSEEEINEYFETLAANSSQVQGFPLQTEFLTTGEMPVAAGTYAHLAFNAAQSGAPVSYQPFVEPVVVVPSGIGLIKNARSPAMAVLFMEYYLTEAQDLLAEQGRVPPRELEEGGHLAGAEFIVTDPATLSGDQGEEWRDRYERLLQGGEVIE